ncbi:MAG: hypothetical protein K2H18_04095, partial [Muribaculaceae bacterium]|nr:hypothetical protein [Muribaculaceae bacterium]
MKRKIKFLIAGIILTLSGCFHVNAENKMVVEGRTWWYQSDIVKDIDNQYVSIPCNIGLTLKNDSTDGWMGCYAIDATDNLTIP